MFKAVTGVRSIPADLWFASFSTGFKPIEQLQTELQEPNSFEVALFRPIRGKIPQKVLIFYYFGRIFETASYRWFGGELLQRILLFFSFLTFFPLLSFVCVPPPPPPPLPPPPLLLLLLLRLLLLNYLLLFLILFLQLTFPFSTLLPPPLSSFSRCVNQT